MKGLFLFFSLVALIVLEIMIASKIIVRVEEEEREDNSTEKIDPLEKLDREIEGHERELKRRLEERKKEPKWPKVYSCWCPGTTFDTYKIDSKGRIYPVDDDCR